MRTRQKLILKIRESRFTKGIAICLVINLIGEIVFPTMALALSSGPVDINQASFEPASTSEMVNLTTGDFTYNIPLLDVDGYPINIAYHGGVGMEQDASVVGLGWTINVGSLNRTKRGIPDDFNGDDIKTEMNLRSNRTIGGDLGGSLELLGFSDVSNSLGPLSINVSPNFSIGVSFNNYVGFSTSHSIGFSAGVSILGEGDGSDNGGSLAGLGINGSLTSNSRDGMTTSLGAGFSSLNGNINAGIGYSHNTTQGLMSKSIYAGTPIAGNSGTIPLSPVSYTPKVQFETETSSLNFKFGIGGEVFGTYGHASIGAFMSQTCLKNSEENVKSYGYLYEQNISQTDYLMDFNREGQILANKDIINLPITNHTYDFYSATAQGLGFSFRPHRSEVGTVGDMLRQHIVNGVGISAEIGLGNLFQAGVNVDIPYGYTRSRLWEEDNEAIGDMEFTDEPPSSTGIDDLLYETSYFKKIGNRSSFDETYYNDLGSASAVKQKIEKNSGGVIHYGREDFIDKGGNLKFKSSDLDHYKSERDYRNTSIQYLTAVEAENYGQYSKVNSYDLTDYTYSNGYYNVSTQTDRYGSLSTQAKQHHLSEMEIVKGDGSRYIYGIPVINQITKEVTFNVSDETSSGPSSLTKNCADATVEYGSSDNSHNNIRGDNNLYLMREVPAYASSYLLTAYLSSNYVDRTQDGPTPDDYGSYTKFNYAKIGTTKWRFPYEENKAGYNEGLKTDEYDDLGSYVYGERDQWYIHSIETKNFVAEFHYGDRLDGYGVEDEDGGRSTSTNTAKKLEKIELYTRKGKELNEAPIKSVVFEYDYSLCQGVPSNDQTANFDHDYDPSTSNISNEGGKLTLKKIYFTYGESKRGKLHNYKFDYSSKNPDYSIGNTDRWGVFKSSSGNVACDHQGDLSNSEFPYSEQNSGTADINAGAWMLQKIHLPSGSDITIETESDNYHYVQNVRAARMFKIRGFSETETFVSADKEDLYDGVGPNNFLHVVLGDLSATQSIAEDMVFNDYLTMEKLYFKSLVRVSPNEQTFPVLDENDLYEYISGYTEYDKSESVVYDSDGDNIYDAVAIKLKDAPVKDELKSPNDNNITNPVTKASWQFTRKYLPKVINPIVGSIYNYDKTCESSLAVPNYEEDSDITQDEDVEDDGDFLEDIINTGKSHLQNILSMGGINFMMKTFKYSSKCVPSKSWVRLTNGNKTKYGGGHRVKKIEVNDNWDQTTSQNENNATYGSEYTYETVESGELISSGVASYEPIMRGGDENALRKPLEYTVDVKMRVNDEEFQELPVGESIFANPQVVYSKITVKNIDYSSSNVTQNTTGKTVYENYTAKDFPIKFDRTNNSKLRSDDRGWTSLFAGESFNNLAMSQGYSIHINDMHGKFKSKKVYPEAVSDTYLPPPIYSIKHNYYTKDGDPSNLENKMTVVDENGNVSNQFIGRDIDVVVDANESESFYQTGKIRVGIDVFLIYAATVPIPSLWYNEFSVENELRTSVTTKVITSNGILKEVELYDKGRYKRSKNLLFDQNTGVPVVTEINHQQPIPGSDYEQPIYQYDYPAYWMYSGMGFASENWGLSFDGNINDVNYTINSSIKPYLEPGDELLVTDGSSFEEKVWVVENESTNDYYIVGENGELPGFSTPSGYSYKVIRSGKRNLLGSTAASVTSITENISTPFTSTPTEVINASAVEYTQRAFGYVSSKNSADPDDYCGLFEGEKVNPYLRGFLGNWNLYKSYVYDHKRDQTTGLVHDDGLLEEYTEFWKYINGEWGINPAQEVNERWINTAFATLFDQEGYNLESKDALGIYSSILLGYNNTLKIGEAVNSRFYEIGFDGFEDHDYDLSQSKNCALPHFRFNEGVEGDVIVSDDYAHTGRYSMRIKGNNSNIRYSDVINEDDVDNSVTDHSVPYTVQSQELVDQHKLLLSETDTNKYILSAWVKNVKSNPTGNQESFDDVKLDVHYDGAQIGDVVEERSNIINGWQRVEILFKIPPETIVPTSPKEFKITLHNSSAGQDDFAYFDDIRIQPFNSEMVTYVIDPITLRLWATLDSRNFATIYQYDEEGSLVRITQETEKGRETVQENRAGIQIQ